MIVWDTTTGEQLASLKGHSGRVIFLILFLSERGEERKAEETKIN